jgi:hypothetical protein
MVELVAECLPDKYTEYSRYRGVLSGVFQTRHGAGGNPGEEIDGLYSLRQGYKSNRALDDGSEPYKGVEERLRFAYRLAKMMSDHERPRVVQAWFTGLNPELGDRVPVRLRIPGHVNTDSGAM